MGVSGENACMPGQRWLMCDAQGELLWGWSELLPGWKRGWSSWCVFQKRVKEPPVLVYVFDVCVAMSAVTFDYACRCQCLGTS